MLFGQDGLGVYQAINTEHNHQGKITLDRKVAMLKKMEGRSYSVKESETVYYSGNDDTDTDGDPDTDKKSDK